MESQQLANYLGGACSVDLINELNRIRQRANARLGRGIDPRSVKKMVSKLDEEKNRR